MSSGASLASIVASIPPGDNPFQYLRGVVRAQISPVTISHAVFPVLYTFMGIYAVVACTTTAGFILRYKKGQLWFYKRAALPNGSLIVPHPVNLFALFSLVYVLASQGHLAGYVTALYAEENGDPVPWQRAYLGELAFIPLFMAACGDMAGSLTGVLTSRFRNGQSVPRWLSVHAVHLLVFGLPLTWILGSIIGFTFIGVKGTALINAYRALDAQLAADQSKWTSGLPLAELLAVEPLALSLEAASSELVRVFKSLYGLFAGCLIMLWMMWAPANYFQIRALLDQIHHLRQTARHEKQQSRDEATAQTQSQVHLQTQSRRSMSAIRSVMRPNGSSQKRSISSLERQAHRLMNQCWTRVFSAVGFTIVVIVYTFIAGWIAKDPQGAVEDPARGFFFITSPFGCFILVGVPVLLIFFQRSFDASALRTNMNETRGSVTQASIAERKAVESHIRRTSKGQLVSFGSRADANPPLMVKIHVETETRVEIEDSNEDEGNEMKHSKESIV